jgi:hypothetical protein
VSAVHHTDWLFEIKWDGFRALLYSDSDGVQVISRNGEHLQKFSWIIRRIGSRPQGPPLRSGWRDSLPRPSPQAAIPRSPVPPCHTFLLCVRHSLGRAREGIVAHALSHQKEGNRRRYCGALGFFFVRACSSRRCFSVSIRRISRVSSSNRCGSCSSAASLQILCQRSRSSPCIAATSPIARRYYGET